MKRLLTFLMVAVFVIALALPASALGDDDLIMTTCDDSTNWTANSQGLDALEFDTEDFTEGTGSVGATAINGKLNQIVYTPSQAMDVSNYRYFEFDIHFTDLTWFNDGLSVMFELTSSGTCDQESNRYMKQVITPLLASGGIEGKVNWWHFVFDLDNPQGTANGKLNKLNFNYFRFYTVDPISTTPDYTLRFDNMRFTNNPDPDHYFPAEDEADDPALTTSDPYFVEHADPNQEILDKYSWILGEYTPDETEKTSSDTEEGALTGSAAFLQQGLNRILIWTAVTGGVVTVLFIGIGLLIYFKKKPKANKVSDQTKAKEASGGQE